MSSLRVGSFTRPRLRVRRALVLRARLGVRGRCHVAVRHRVAGVALVRVTLAVQQRLRRYVRREGSAARLF